MLNSLASAVRGERERNMRIRHAFSFGQCEATQSILHRHNATLEAADLIEVFCSRIEVLARWGYSDQQQTWLKERLDRVTGVSRQVVWTYGQEVVLERLNLGKPEPPPFLLGVLNPSFRALTAARMLQAISKGRWSDDECTYVQFFRYDLLGGADVGPLW